MYIWLMFIKPFTAIEEKGFTLFHMHAMTSVTKVSKRCYDTVMDESCDMFTWMSHKHDVNVIKPNVT